MRRPGRPRERSFARGFRRHAALPWPRGCRAAKRRFAVPMIVRRLTFILPTLALTGVTAALAYPPMAANGFGLADALMLLLLVLSSGYVTAQSWQVVLGLLHRAFAGRKGDQGAGEVDCSRLAVVMPICDEDVAGVFGAVAAIRRSMRDAGLAVAPVFVLSDTRSLARAEAEETAFAATRAETAGLPELRYRRRAVNARRKAGNIAEFCERHGDAFEFMLVLDADSVMSGATIRRMAETMAADPKLGLVQTLCFPARRLTLFARIQQFAARLYAPLHTEGMTFWTGGDAIYWGHNAMIRVQPFREHCELPILAGRPPLGGEILCHDVVEAAFLRRAGWEVRMLPDLDGTWEDMPSNTLDFAQRDRRWCQGNLQHLALLAEKGLTWPFLFHLVNGIFAYASAPVWLLFLIVGTLQYASQPAASVGGGADTLLAPAVAAPVLFGLSLTVIFLPKVLSIALTLADRRRRRAFGGAGPLLASAIAETLFGILWNPMSLVFYTGFVVATLAGRTVAWDPQHRTDRGVGWGEATRRHRWHMAIALLWGALVWRLDPAVFWWMSPLFAGLLLSAPLTVLSSRMSLGLAAARLRLFLTPDETEPAPELLSLRAETAKVEALLAEAPSAEGTARASVPRAAPAGRWPSHLEPAEALR
nr:glucans biosynthesis glucosyltransferase MdoH [Aureimonas leprariae]